MPLPSPRLVRYLIDRFCTGSPRIVETLRIFWLVIYLLGSVGIYIYCVAKGFLLAASYTIRMHGHAFIVVTGSIH